MEKKYLTKQETATMLKVSLRTLERWNKSKTLQSSKIGRRVLYDPIEIEQKIKCSVNQ